MRITHRMTTQKYNRNLNQISYQLDKAATQAYTGNRISKSSEDTASAVRAFKLRENRSKLADYQGNIGHAYDYLANVESTLTHVHKAVENALIENIEAALNSPNSNTQDRNIYAANIKQIQEQLLQTLNNNSSGSYIMGGANTTTRPFGVDADGNLTYQGRTLKDLDPATNPADAQFITDMKEKGLSVDIGLGLSFGGGALDPNSVFTYSVSGLELMTLGTTQITIDGTSSSVPANIYDLLTEVVNELQKPDQDYAQPRLDALFGQLKNESKTLFNSITNIGAKTSYLDFMKDRYSGQDIMLEDRLSQIEDIDFELAAINYETQRLAYNAALKLGSSVIPPSIFDYMR